MSKDSKWKDYLLKSGLPLEYEAKTYLDKKGCVSKMEYSYLRKNQNNTHTEFSYDIDSSYIKKAYYFDLMIECKYRHESTKWLFLPEEYGGVKEINYLSCLHPNDHFTTSHKFEFSNCYPSFPLKLGPLCSKGIEITSDGPNPKTISQAVSQLSYAMPEKIFSGMKSQVDPDSQSLFGEMVFFNIPIILTTAKLYRANSDLSINQIKSSESIENIATEENLLVLKTENGVELEAHNFLTLQKSFESHGREYYEKKLNSFNDDLDFVASVIAEEYSPSCIIVIHHSSKNEGLDKLFNFLNRIIDPDKEIYDLMEKERKRMEKMTKKLDAMAKTNMKNK